MIRLLLCAALAIAAPAFAAPPDPLFASEEPIRLTLQAPMAELVRQAQGEERPVAGTLTLQGAAPETHAVQLSPRGITRRRRDVCSFPPIRVEFTAKPAATSLFKGQKGLKLVTHCRPAERFQQLMLLEHAAYRLYNQLTPVSFNVRLAEIDYRDEAGRPVASRMGFFIEDVDDLAERIGLKRLRTTARQSADQLDPRAAARFALFQVMIGNLDWSMLAGPPGDGCCHNSRLIGREGAASGLIPTPYDFDFSGLVDAPYATPPQGIEAANVRIRRYRGYCRHAGEVPAVAADFASRKSALLGVLANDSRLEPRTRDKALAYLDGFFTEIADPTRLKALQRTCVA